jgi:hypothetical protein
MSVGTIFAIELLVIASGARPSRLASEYQRNAYFPIAASAWRESVLAMFDQRLPSEC